MEFAVFGTEKRRKKLVVAEKCDIIFNMEEKEILAKNLVKFRKRAGLSQIDIAKKLNYSNKNISKWENGETMPNAFVLQKIAKIYGVSIEALLCENETLPPADLAQQESKAASTRKKIFRYTMLVMANAILYTFGAALVYVLKLVGVTNFNLSLIYLYLSPLSFLSIVIFVRVLYKFVDLFSISAIVWLFCLSMRLTFLDVPHMAFIFVVGGIFEVIIICIALLVNLKIFKRGKKTQTTKHSEQSIVQNEKTATNLDEK